MHTQKENNFERVEELQLFNVKNKRFDAIEKALLMMSMET